MKNLILFALIIGIFACTNPNTQLAEKANADSLNYEMITMVQSLDDCDIDSPTCTFISFVYPQFTDATGQIKDSLEIFIKGNFRNEADIITSPDSVQIGFLNAYKSFVKSQKENTQAWNLQKSITVINQNSKWITLKVDGESYMGGAHPNSITNFIMMDMKTGKRLNLIDFFDSTAILKLTALGEPLFCAEKKIKPDMGLDEAGFWFPNNHFALNNNFFINDEGITFYYNSYEVAPYAVGPTQITIPASSAIKYLKN